MAVYTEVTLLFTDYRGSVWIILWYCSRLLGRERDESRWWDIQLNIDWALKGAWQTFISNFSHCNFCKRRLEDYYWYMGHAICPVPLCQVASPNLIPKKEWFVSDLAKAHYRSSRVVVKEQKSTATKITITKSSFLWVIAPWISLMKWVYTDGIYCS